MRPPPANVRVEVEDVLYVIVDEVEDSVIPVDVDRFQGVVAPVSVAIQLLDPMVRLRVDELFKTNNLNVTLNPFELNPPPFKKNPLAEVEDKASFRV